MTEPCREMLRSALPHALASLPEERHAYQNELIEVIMGICSANESKHRAEVQADEGEVDQLEERTKQALAELESAKISAATKNGDKENKANIMLEVQQSVDKAKLVLGAEKENEKENISAQQGVIEQKKGYEEALVDVWEPLKESKLVGQTLRKERNKAMARLTTMIATTSAPESLTSALVLALKQKVDSRTSFAQKAVGFAETSLKEHIESLSSKIESLEAKNTEVLACVTAAESALKIAEEKLQAAQDESVTAENAWCSQESAAVLAKDACDKLQAEAESTAQALAESKADLAVVLELNLKVEALRDHRTQAAPDEVEEQMEMLEVAKLVDMTTE